MESEEGLQDSVLFKLRVKNFNKETAFFSALVFSTPIERLPLLGLLNSFLLRVSFSRLAALLCILIRKGRKEGVFSRGALFLLFLESRERLCSFNGAGLAGRVGIDTWWVFLGVDIEVGLKEVWLKGLERRGKGWERRGEVWFKGWERRGKGWWVSITFFACFLFALVLSVDSEAWEHINRHRKDYGGILLSCYFSQGLKM